MIQSSLAEHIEVPRFTPPRLDRFPSALHEIDGCDVKSLSIRREDEGLTIEADLKAGPTCDLESSLGDIAHGKDVTGLDLA